jgi:FtsH-binding integral membrane protein
MESMLYLKSNKAAMKIQSQTMRIAFWVMLGLAILFTSLALNRTPPVAQGTTATPTIQAGMTVAATGAHDRDDVGSTDGIMIVAVLIVLIVIIPILLKRQVWAKGTRK